MLLVLADGPRNAADAAACAAARAVTEQVDWPCRVLRNYSEKNLGARRRISSGLDWAFEQVEDAIILEDDCLPHPSFFPYCDELLDRYRTNPRVGCISGDNFQNGHARGEASYFFANHFHGWGWATWKQKWAAYDHDMQHWPEFRDRQGLEHVLDDSVAVAYWREFLDRLQWTGEPDAWDYIWMLSCWMNEQLTLHPHVNLVTNIGFGEGATNTTGAGNETLSRPLESIGPLAHPAAVACDAEADRYIFNHVFPGNRLRKEQRWRYRLHRRLWRIKQSLLGRFG